MIIKEGQIWQGFYNNFQLSVFEVLEVINDIIGFTDGKEIYFMKSAHFERRFEYKA